MLRCFDASHKHEKTCKYIYIGELVEEPCLDSSHKHKETCKVYRFEYEERAEEDKYDLITWYKDDDERQDGTFIYQGYCRGTYIGNDFWNYGLRYCPRITCSERCNCMNNVWKSKDKFFWCPLKCRCDTVR